MATLTPHTSNHHPTAKHADSHSHVNHHKLLHHLHSTNMSNNKNTDACVTFETPREKADLLYSSTARDGAEMTIKDWSEVDRVVTAQQGVQKLLPLMEEFVRIFNCTVVPEKGKRGLLKRTNNEWDFRELNVFFNRLWRECGTNMDAYITLLKQAPAARFYASDFRVNLRQNTKQDSRGFMAFYWIGLLREEQLRVVDKIHDVYGDIEVAHDIATDNATLSAWETARDTIKKCAVEAERLRETYACFEWRIIAVINLHIGQVDDMIDGVDSPSRDDVHLHMGLVSMLYEEACDWVKHYEAERDVGKNVFVKAGANAPLFMDGHINQDAVDMGFDSDDGDAVLITLPVYEHCSPRKRLRGESHDQGGQGRRKRHCRG